MSRIWLQRKTLQSRNFIRKKICLCALYKISNLKQNNPHFKEQIKMQVVLFADSETKYSYQNL